MRWYQRLFRRALTERQLDAELRFHLDQKIADLVATGITPEDARRRALLEFGGLDRVKEECREVGTAHFLEILIQDLRYAVRQLLKSRGFTVSAIVSLALGIGATTAFFSLVYAVLFDPFPYKDANRIVYVQLHGKEPGYGPFRANGSQFEAIRNVPTVEDVFFQKPPAITTLTSENSRLVVKADFYSLGFFGVLGVPPLLGRVFTSADAQRGNPAPVAVVSHRFWMQDYAGSRGVLGKTIELNHTPYMVIGVMPPRFTWLDSEVYLPGAPSVDPKEYWMVFPKLKPGANRRAAEAEFQFLVDRFAKEDPSDYPQGSRVKIVTLTEEALGNSESVIGNLFAAAVVLLIIGCANVSILLLARGMARQHEFAVRSSVGASRGRLICQLLTESVLLSLAGALFGVLAAYWVVKVMPRLLPDDLLPHEVAVQLNVPVLLFSAMAAVTIGVFFGLSPALELSRPQLASMLQSSSMKVAGGTRSRAMHRLPIAGQVALTVLLLGGAAGAAKLFLAKLHAIHGFDPDHVFTFFINPRTPATSLMPQQRIQKMEAARQAVAQTPGVAEAGFSVSWWPGIMGATQKIEIWSKPALNNSEAAFTPISPQVLSVLRVPLLRGRIFTNAEVLRQQHVAMVNEAFCKRYLGGLDPIGQRVRIPSLNKYGWDSSLSGKAPDDWMEVIGVAGDATNDTLDHPEVRPAVFFPYTFEPSTVGRLYARASGDPVTAMRSAEVQLRQFVPDLATTAATTLQRELAMDGWGRERLVAEILGFYAGVALVLAAAGLYGVVSFAVTHRFHELGIRMALGAGRGAVVRLVLASTAAMLGFGLVVSFIISVILTPIISAWGGGSLFAPLNLLGASLILVIVAAIACAYPAWRAASIDPMVTLRYE